MFGEVGAQIRLDGGVGFAPPVALRRELVERDLDVGFEEGGGGFAEKSVDGVPELGRDDSFQSGDYQHKSSDFST